MPEEFRLAHLDTSTLVKPEAEFLKELLSEMEAAGCDPTSLREADAYAIIDEGHIQTLLLNGGLGYGVRLSKIPPSIKHLSHLDDLRLINLNLPELPTEILQCSELFQMNLYGNRLRHWGDEFAALNKLRVLVLENNPLAYIHSYQDHPVLLSLYAAHTQIETENVHDLLVSPSLFGLELSHIPKVKDAIPNITIDEVKRSIINNLYLQGIGLESLGCLASLPKLSKISLNENNLQEEALSIPLLQNLTHCKIAHNRIARLPEARYPKLVLLDMSHNPIEGIEKRLTPEQFPSLCGLGACGIRLTEIPATLRRFPNLQGLFLSENHITSIPAWLFELPRFIMLWLAANQLRDDSFPKAVHDLPLKEIDLRFNRLTRPPQFLSRCPEITYCNTFGNPFSAAEQEKGTRFHYWYDIEQEKATKDEEWTFHSQDVPYYLTTTSQAFLDTL